MADQRELAGAFRALVPTANVSYVLSAEHKIMRWNPAWEAFGRANGGDDFIAHWRRGTSLLDVLPVVLRPFFTEGFARAVRDQTPWAHEYECSSPDVFREFRMIAYPYGEMFVVTHALTIERAHDRGAVPPGDEHVRDGVVVMCSHCRRVRSAGEGERWDWVPAFIASPPIQTSHGLCGACAQYYYGAAMMG